MCTFSIQHTDGPGSPRAALCHHLRAVTAGCHPSEVSRSIELPPWPASGTGAERAKVTQPQRNSTWTSAGCAAECKPSPVFWGACAHQKCISRNDQDGHAKLEEPVKLCVLLVSHALAAQVFPHALRLPLLPGWPALPHSPTDLPWGRQLPATGPAAGQECCYKRDPRATGNAPDPMAGCPRAAQPSPSPRAACCAQGKASPGSGLLRGQRPHGHAGAVRAVGCRALCRANPIQKSLREMMRRAASDLC